MVIPMPDITFASLLRSARTEAGLTQKAASELLNVPKRTIESWEEGKRVPATYTQSTILQALRGAGKEQK